MKKRTLLKIVAVIVTLAISLPAYAESDEIVPADFPEETLTEIVFELADAEEVPAVTEDPLAEVEACPLAEEETVLPEAAEEVLSGDAIPAEDETVAEETGDGEAIPADADTEEPAAELPAEEVCEEVLPDGETPVLDGEPIAEESVVEEPVAEEEPVLTHVVSEYAHITVDHAGESVDEGTAITLHANLSAYEGMNYTITWQYTADGGATVHTVAHSGSTYTFIADSVTVTYLWRAVITYEVID